MINQDRRIDHTIMPNLPPQRPQQAVMDDEAPFPERNFDRQELNPILPRFELIVYGHGLPPRGEDEILSSNPQEAAHLIAKLQAGVCRRRTGNELDGEQAASRYVSAPGADDIAHRFAIFVRRPGQQRRPGFFGARIVIACATVLESRLP
jgi:hypothetical protein